MPYNVDYELINLNCDHHEQTIFKYISMQLCAESSCSPPFVKLTNESQTNHAAFNRCVNIPLPQQRPMLLILKVIKFRMQVT